MLFIFMKYDIFEFLQSKEEKIVPLTLSVNVTKKVIF